MTIRFSRHAKRRAKLYGIPETMVSDILGHMHLHLGEHVIIQDVGQKYPLKIVTFVERDMITVVTNYLLKKGQKNESPLR